MKTWPFWADGWLLDSDVYWDKATSPTGFLNWVHCSSRSQSNRTPSGCGGMGDLHCAAEKCAANVWHYHAWGMLPAPYWTYATKNQASSEGKRGSKLVPVYLLKWPVPVLCVHVFLQTFSGGLNISLTSGTCCRLRSRSVWCTDFTRRSTAAAWVLVSVDRNTTLSSSCETQTITCLSVSSDLFPLWLICQFRCVTYVNSTVCVHWKMRSANRKSDKLSLKADPCLCAQDSL